MRILIVEDEDKLRHNLSLYLRHQKYSIDEASDGEEGLELALVEDYDLIILDLGLPKLSGIEVCQQIRAEEVNTPILMLTARDTVDDKISGLDAGADDYLIKPFSLEELSARIRALLRRKSTDKSPILSLDTLTLDPVTHQVTRAGSNLSLSAKEYSLLEYLLRHVNQIISKQILLEHIWGSEIDPFSKVIDVYIGYLRNKIDRDFPEEKPLIHTTRGMGYQLRI
jgi:DNA-binding response OmpR family regulator